MFACLLFAMISLATLDGIGLLRAVIGDPVSKTSLTGPAISPFVLYFFRPSSFFRPSFFILALRSSSCDLHSSLQPFETWLWCTSFINLAETHTSIMSGFDKFLNPAFCANNINSPCPNKTSKANNACSRCYLVVVSPLHFDLFKALCHILTKIKTVL